MSNRAAEYREVIDSVVNSGLLDADERAELRDMLARVERKILAHTSAQPAREAAE